MSVGLGGADSSALRFSRTRGRTGSSADYGLQYPSPFFDIGQTYLPATVKQMFRWCRYYFLVNPLINAVVSKMADYPITDIILDTEKQDLKDSWNSFLNEQLRYRPFQIEIGLDFYTYGNALVSIFYPFVKMLRCTRCGFEKQASDAIYRFMNFEFHWQCEQCDHAGIAKVRDHYIKAPKGIKLLRWNPEDIDIRYNDISGEYEYYYSIPVQLKNDIIIGKKSAVESVPQLFIDALRLRKAVVFSRDNIYHFKRPTLAGKDRGWGTPMILPVLKDTFYLQVLRKAQECLTPNSFLEKPLELCKASEIRIGDLVKTHTGAFKRVTAICPKIIDEQNGGFTIQVATKAMKAFPTGYSDNHPLDILRGKPANGGNRSDKYANTKYVRRYTDEYKPQWVNAGDAKLGEYVVYPVGRQKDEKECLLDLAKYTGLPATKDWVYQQAAQETAEDFETLEQRIELPWATGFQCTAHQLHRGNKKPPRVKRYLSLDEDLAYLAGWYTGDGSTSARQISMALGLNDDHKLLAKTFKKVFGKEPRVSKSKRFNGRLLVFSDVIATKFMRGWIPGGAHTKSLPREIQQAPDHILLAFLRGYIESDGCFHDGLDRITVSSVSPQLAYQVWKLLISFRCVARVTKREGRETTIEDKQGRQNKCKSGVAYDVIVDGSSGRRLRALLYGGKVEEATGGHAGFFLGDYFASPICEWERLTEQHVLSFEVEGDHTFCTPGMATHNSIALEHIVPLRMLFPQAGSATSDPYCVALDSFVETRDGIKPAGEVKQGEYMKTHSGAWEPVEFVVDRPMRPEEKAYEFTIASLSAFPFKVSEEHPLLAAKRPANFRGYGSIEEPDFIEAQNVEEGDFVCYPRRRITWDRMDIDLHDYHPERACTLYYIYRRLNQESAEIYEYFESCGVPEFEHGAKAAFLQKYGWSDQNYLNARAAFTQGDSVDRRYRYLEVTEGLSYLIGLYAAEGSPKDTCASLSLNVNEGAIMDKVDTILAGLGVSHGHRYTRGNSTQYDIGDIFIGGLLTQLCGKGAANKHLPRLITEAPDSIALRAVEGVMAGDGCSICTGTRREGLKTVSPQLAVDVRTLLLSFGLIATVQKNIPGADEIAKLPYYQVNLNGTQGEEFCNLLHGEAHHKSFSRCGFMRGDYVYLRVDKRVEAPEVDVVRGFQIARSKSFCVVGVATHNTTVNLQDWHDQIAGELRRWRCVTPDSFVETINGLQRAGDVGVGDQLKNRYGIFETVTKRHERQMDDGESAYRLTVRGQHAIDTVYSEEHPIWAAKKINNGNGHKLGSADFIPVSELTPGDYVGYPTVRLINEVEKLDLAEYVDRAVTEEWVYIDHTDIDVPAIFEYLSAHGEVSSRKELLEEHGWGLNSYKCAQAAIREGRTLRRVPRYLNLDQELAWVLGLYAAEGNTTVKGVFFSLHKDETAFVDKLDRFFASRFGASKTGGEKSENGIQIAYPSIVAAQFFHSLIPGTAINKRLPDVIRHATDDIAVAAVNGVLDGDGSYYEDKTVLGVSSRQLAEDTRQLMLSWQVMPGISFVEGQDVTICGKKTKGHGCYLVQVSGDSHKQLSAILAGETYSGSTFSRIGLFREGFAWFRIEEVAKVEADTVVAFQMDGDSTFCTWGVATHNSDNNYIPILPLPIGQETIGGDGRALLLSQEIRVWSEHIVAGMGVPNELIFGGLSYSGSNVSLRMLENMFLGYLSDQLSLLRWVIDRTASYLSWPKVGARFKPFKMADDLQRKAYLFQLNQAGKMSDESLLADADYDSAKEDKIMEMEASRRVAAMKKQRLLQAEMEGEATLVTAKWQNKAQAKAMVEQAAIQTEAAKEQMSFQSEMQNGMMQDQMAAQTGQPAPQKSPDLTPTPRNPALISPPKEITSPLTMSSIQQHPASATNSDIAGGMNVDLLYVARQLADRIARLTPAEKPVTLRRLQERSPELHDTVVGLMMSGANGPTAASAASARALPRQKPPQRGPEAAMV